MKQYAYENLEAVRRYHNDRVEDLAAMLGLSKAGLTKKRKSGCFSVREAKILCKHYGRDFDFLFAEENED